MLQVKCGSRCPSAGESLVLVLVTVLFFEFPVIQNRSPQRANDALEHERAAAGARGGRRSCWTPEMERLPVDRLEVQHEPGDEDGRQSGDRASTSVSGAGEVNNLGLCAHGSEKVITLLSCRPVGVAI